jgi:flagellar motor protein MotB
LIIWLGNDEGNSVLELKEKVNQSDGSAMRIEEIAGRLYYDPSSKIKIIGNADPSPTNIDGTKPNVSGENNIDLALQRADAAENYLRNYYKETYGVDLSCERIKTDYDTESSRSISISINTTNQ